MHWRSTVGSRSAAWRRLISAKFTSSSTSAAVGIDIDPFALRRGVEND
jgi:hypothetical protein